MSMTHKIFKNMFFMTITIFLVSSVLLIGVMYGYFSRQRRSELRAEAQWLAAAVNADGMTFLETGAKSEEIRLTHVAADGTVLFDSSFNVIGRAKGQHSILGSDCQITVTMEDGVDQEVDLKDKLAMTMPIYDEEKRWYLDNK